MDRGAWQATVCGVTELDTTEQLSTHTHTHTHTNLFHLDFSKALLPLSLFPHLYISGRYIKTILVQPFLFLPALGGSFPNGLLTSGLSSLKAILPSRSRVVFLQCRSSQLTEWRLGLGTSCLGALGGCLVLCSMFSIPGL